MRTCNSFASGMIGIEGCVPEDDVLAIERAVTLANRHRRLPRVEPHGGEAIGFGIEAGDSSARAAGAFRSIRPEEYKIRLQELAVLDHVLLAGTFRYNWLPISGKECLDHIPVTRKLREQFLAGAWSIGGFVLIVGLLRDGDGGSGKKQRSGDPFPHIA